MTFQLAPLPIEWVHRLFGRFAVRYGDEWVRKWEGTDMTAVHRDWAEQLAGMHLTPAGQARLRYGIEHMPERPPTVTAFRAICNRAPEPKQPLLRDAKPIDQARAEMLRRAVRSLGRSSAIDPIGWAHRVIERHESGEWIATPAALEMARRAIACMPECADNG
jgi:hypothetical protein